MGADKPTSLDPFTFYVAPETLLRESQGSAEFFLETTATGKGHAEQGSNTG